MWKTDPPKQYELSAGEWPSYASITARPKSDNVVDMTLRCCVDESVALPHETARREWPAGAIAKAHQLLEELKKAAEDKL